MPGVMRHLVFDAEHERKASIIVQLSNDGWFGDWQQQCLDFLAAKGFNVAG